MKQPTTHRRVARSRRGLALVAALLLLVVSGTMATQLIFSFVHRIRHTQTELALLQTRQITDAAIRQLQQMPAEQRETPLQWTVPVQEDQTKTARVRITIQDQTATVETEWAAASDHPVRLTRKVLLEP